MKFSTMTDKDMFEAMQQIAEICRTEANFIDEMRKRTFRFPRNPAEREELIDSHQRIMAKLQQDTEEMYAELMRRWEKFTNAA